MLDIVKDKSLDTNESLFLHQKLQKNLPNRKRIGSIADMKIEVPDEADLEKN
jgi:hypothetical protein